MKVNTILLFILLTASNFMFSQVIQDSLDVNYIYAPKYFNNSFSAEESWEIHKAAYIKQLKSKGLTDDEIKRSMVTYEKDKEEFITQVKEQHRLAAIQSKKADEQSRIADEERMKADQERMKADQERMKADHELLKADQERMKANEWKKKFEYILIENITLSNQSINNKPIIFNVTSKVILRIGIRAQVSSGTALIEIYNPNGVKEAELSLEHKTESGPINHSDFFKNPSGSLDKTISYAEVGEWQIKISSQKAEGTVAMSVAQYIKPTMDE